MSLKINFKILGFILILVILISSGLFYWNQKQVKNTIKIGYQAINKTLPVWVAQEKGFFKDAGLDVELQLMSSGNLGIEAVVKGDLQVQYSPGYLPVLQALSVSPDKFKIFSNEINQNQDWDGVYSLKENSVKNLSDLTNKKIGVIPGSASTSYIKHKLQQIGLDQNKVEYIQLSPQDQITALKSKQIDSLFATEPNKTILELDPSVQKISKSIFYENPDAVIAVNIINQDFLSNHPEDAKKIIKVLDQAQEYVKNNETESRKTISKYMKVNDEVANKMVLVNFTKSNQIDEQNLKKYSLFLKEIGELKQIPELGNVVYKS